MFQLQTKDQGLVVGLRNIAVQVSARTVLRLIAGILLLPPLTAQTMADAGKPPRPPATRPLITPEQRGDIYMVRKMYREAIDVYSQEPES